MGRLRKRTKRRDMGASPSEGKRAGPLGIPDPIRGFFENRYGLDLGAVRMHTDAEAARQADQLDARAFTHGEDISFGRGEYSPHTESGRRLLAHELAHVAQHKASPESQPRIFRQPKTRGNWVLKEPPVQLETGPTCSAAALASWLLVKGIVQQGFSARFLIDHYHGTACTDSVDALIGDANADVEAVFAQWHVQVDLGKTIAPADFNLLVMDPLQGMRRMAPWAIEYDMSIGVGLPGGAGPAPCSLRRRS